MLLVDNPLAGPARPDIADECRHLVLGNYLILYRYQDGQVDLVRLVHGRRNITKGMFLQALQ
ncbi:MAG: type II toxin-antitoxin system RelE/ParE family toxin [Alphaproteobacteria bacterium]|nr:type II toxin-antitoxin system RelE/ParE family toxin [Alphaproteobacteria bacterium]